MVLSNNRVIICKILRILPETNPYICVSYCFSEETDIEAGKKKVSVYDDDLFDK